MKAAAGDSQTSPLFGWIILTMGDRPGPLGAAVQSLLSAGGVFQVVVVCNGTSAAVIEASLDADDRLLIVESRVNLGIPGGRHFGVQHLDPQVELVGFLDDDAAVISPDITAMIDRNLTDAACAAVSLRIVDEQGESARRHVPRPGRGSADRSGPVVTFLGGACVVRRSAYNEVGGYWPALWYGHEELDLAWRLADAGWSVKYEADVVVVHPRGEISRHVDGWRLTGRNRVMVARRNLPWPLLVLHTVCWLVVGLLRAPTGCRLPYASGWRRGWSVDVPRQPIRWATVWRLTRLGRPPII